ncbi:SEC-C metal-binding domain-containing protein [Desulfolithobacter sp.]
MLLEFNGNGYQVVLEENGVRTRYDLTLLTCDNPVCTCTTVDIILTPAGADGSDDADSLRVAFRLDLKERRLEKKGWLKRQKREKECIRAFMAGLGEEDFLLLLTIYTALKAAQSEGAEPGEIEAEFDFDGIENQSLMTYYNEILPHANRFFLKIDGKTFSISDSYCLKRGCRCARVIFSVNRVDTKKLKTILVGILEGDYRRKRIKTVDSRDRDPGVDLERIRRELLQQYPELMATLRKRHRRLHQIYAACRQRKFGITSEQKGGKVGRNDPCPCGSGRKYKKCCLGKE